MARHYHIDIARVAAGADRKWIDNLLSAETVSGVESAHQGIARRISTRGIYHIALVHYLNQDLGIAVHRAVPLAERLLTTDATHVGFPGHLELRLDRAAFQRELDHRIAEAVESTVPARRGRPPKIRL